MSKEKLYRQIVKPLVGDFHSMTLEKFILHVFVSGVAFGIQQKKGNKNDGKKI